MNIRPCKAVMVEKEIYGSRDFFVQGDIVQVECLGNTVKGRIADIVSWGYDEFSLVLDTSKQYEQKSTEIKMKNISDIKKIPD